MKSTENKKKSKLHPQNPHQERYDLKELAKTSKELKPFIVVNKFNDESIDFSNAEAVKALNKALLQHYYNISFWDIPEGYLCPPVPGRADYIHHIAQLLSNSNFGKIPKGKDIKCLDIGVGANCIYPIIGSTAYGWSFLGSDIDETALKAAQEIVSKNKTLTTNVELKLQTKPKDILYGILKKEDRFDLSICNPPFHASMEEANNANLRKVNNLTQTKTTQPAFNFGGTNSELWTDGGENKFIRNLARESKKFGASCFWFTTLVSKQSNLKSIYHALDNENAVEIKTIAMGTGNKSTRIVAWTFLTPAQQKDWRTERWKD